MYGYIGEYLRFALFYVKKAKQSHFAFFIHTAGYSNVISISFQC